MGWLVHAVGRAHVFWFRAVAVNGGSATNDGGAGMAQALAKSLDAKCMTVEQGNHFPGSDGSTAFPLVLAERQKAVASSGR